MKKKTISMEVGQRERKKGNAWNDEITEIDENLLFAGNVSKWRRCFKHFVDVYCSLPIAFLPLNDRFDTGLILRNKQTISSFTTLWCVNGVVESSCTLTRNLFLPWKLLIEQNPVNERTIDNNR